MHDQVAIVTGANTGIGYEIARGLLEKGATVVLACRDRARADAARAQLVSQTGNDKAVVMLLDLANVARTRNFVTKFEKAFPRLDVLVHNAGVWPRTRRRTEDGFELALGVNHVGPFLVTHLLRPLLEKSAPSRIVVLTSSLHAEAELDFEDLHFKVRKHQGSVGYGQSKLANVLFTHALARRLEGTRVTVNCVHPGVVATELAREAPHGGRNTRGSTPREGAQGPLHLATSPALAGVSGKYFVKTEVQQPSALSLDVAVQEKLWAASMAMLKLG
jgi:NAD(P)-dependent dehydrogenase (short-subunit alcohol dehydrogenase family)